ncbi:MAG: aminopeptidase, partial [Planctomycetota bacterium]
RAEGIIVIDGSIGDLGNVAKPLKITVAGGSIFGLESEDQELVKEVEKLVSVDSEASVIGELGIGLNPGAKLTGNLLEAHRFRQQR